MNHPTDDELLLLVYDELPEPRGVELESVDDIDDRQIAEWMKQVAAVPGVGGKKR